MSLNPVSSWNSAVLAASETTFATPLDPAVGQLMQLISFKTGPVEQGNVRGMKDRGPGRGQQFAFIEGRVEPIAWGMELSQKSRSAIDAAAAELVLFKAAGLKQTLNSSTNAAYSLVADPQATGDFASATLRRILGHADNSNAREAETLFGAYVEQLEWSGGDKELTLSATGKAAGKRVSGALEGTSTITLADGVGTTLTITAADSWKLQVGEYYICESEVIKVTAITHGATSCTIARAQLSTSGAAHSAKPLYPYFPTVSALSGRPITEAVCTASFGGVSTRILSWGITMKTGIEGLPGETGSTRIQGVKMKRYDFTGKARLVLKGDDVALAGKVNDRATAGAVAVSIVQGTGTGGVATFSMPYCEVMPFEVPDTFDDVAVVDVAFRVRENAGSDAFTMVLT